MKKFENKNDIRQSILDVEDTQIEEVFVPEWGFAVLVKGLSAKQRDIYLNSQVKTRGGDTRTDLRDSTARIVSMCVVDETGSRVFSKADLARLGDKNGAALEQIAKVASRLSGLREKDVEGFKEDFDEGQSDDFASD